ncbi:Uncharacterised protein [Vibrio cholerae]|nr:Uncharacterised protein [Vibrio cholerae]
MQVRVSRSRVPNHYRPYHESGLYRRDRNAPLNGVSVAARSPRLYLPLRGKRLCQCDTNAHQFARPAGYI